MPENLHSENHSILTGPSKYDWTFALDQADYKIPFSSIPAEFSLHCHMPIAILFGQFPQDFLYKYNDSQNRRKNNIPSFTTQINNWFSYRTIWNYFQQVTNQ